MAISILQTATFTQVSGASSLAVTITVTAGSVLHVYGTWAYQNSSPDIGDTQGGVTDNKNGTYCPICRVDNGVQVAKHWYIENAAAGSTIITLTCNDIVPNLAIYVEEIGGLPTTGTLVGRAYNSQASPGTGTDAVTSTTALLVAGSQIICGVSINTALGTAPTAGTGFTTDATNPTWMAGHCRQESLITSSGGNTAATFTAVTGSNAHLTLMASFGTVSTSHATGGYVSTDGTNVVHTFVTTGANTFTPSQSLTVDSLVVAGGGAGGSDPAGGQGGGGGGAGGVLYTTGSSVTAQAYTVTVGTGGTSTVTNGGTGNNGVNSSISILALTATGGGGGANTGAAGVNGANGGSGGGASALGSVSSTGGTGVGGQGNAGGNCTVGGAVTNPGGGGGGGAGAAGTTYTAADDVGGPGGDGVSNSITGCAIYYGGGGGGAGDNAGATGVAYGGKGGGGSANGTGGDGNDAEPNSGGGGGGTGADGQTVAGKGGTGIIIIRYPIAGATVTGSAVDVSGTWDAMIDGDICFSSTWNQIIEIDVCVGGVWNKQVP
jgi:hypothetical protein